MSKSKPKKLKSSPVMVHGHAATPGEARKLRLAILGPRFLSTLCFSSAGLLVGFATGLNHFPSLGAMFGSKDLPALSNQSVDWEQLLRVGGRVGGWAGAAAAQGLLGSHAGQATLAGLQIHILLSHTQPSALCSASRSSP